jgi:hypothetical protein
LRTLAFVEVTLAIEAGGRQLDVFEADQLQTRRLATDADRGVER